MRNLAIITLFFLIPMFALLNEDISWERLSINLIRKTNDKTSVRCKLIELGISAEGDYENFRYKQIILIFISTCAVILLGLFKYFSFIAVASLSLAVGVFILYITEQKLNRQVKEHRNSIESDFPTIVEVLTLALSAGETPLTSMQRIANSGSGSLAYEFSRVIQEVSDGQTFTYSLDAMGRRVNSLAIRRFVDSVVIAITRGAPLIDVLHSHAREARDIQRNNVLAAAGKAELSMMVPVVFLILPISILFALWPSIANLNLFANG